MSSPLSLSLEHMPVEIQYYIIRYAAGDISNTFALMQTNKNQNEIVAQFLQEIESSFQKDDMLINGEINYQYVYEKQLQGNGPSHIRTIVARILNQKQEAECHGEKGKEKFNEVYGQFWTTLSYRSYLAIDQWLEDRALLPFCEAYSNTFHDSYSLPLLYDAAGPLSDEKKARTLRQWFILSCQQQHAVL